ncbi:MAG: hypothetical protein J7604_15805 [Sporocytophaga sp.]|uniref:hypothetical protein n=1 Tax=Sporocytophaga sp. TaxID=2231183 RepID=UPI001B21BC6A|nr:hypothetical protein [Sporocytophaga sp.]MBO9701671.1 hypothetical protein [Sporocytophaga sp.]
MKKIFTLACLCMLQVLCFAQNSGFYYQGVAKMKGGIPITNQTISIYISILSTSPDKLFYKESHLVKTDDAGRFSLVVGEGTEVQGKFIEVDWRSKELWIQTEMDAGMGVEDMGKSRILPVPVAAYALNALKIPYDFKINTSSFPIKIKQGESGFVGLEVVTYLYEHEPVQVFVENTASGANISPLNFTLLGNGKSVSVTPGRNMALGTYEVPYTAKAASGKERTGKLLFNVIEDSLSKYVAGKWNVTVGRSGMPDTTYIENIVIVDSMTVKFSNSVLFGGLPLLNNQIGKITANGGNYGLKIEYVPFTNPSLSNTEAGFVDFFNAKKMVMTVQRRYDVNFRQTIDYFNLTFTR